MPTPLWHADTDISIHPYLDIWAASANASHVFSSALCTRDQRPGLYPRIWIVCRDGRPLDARYDANLEPSATPIGAQAIVWQWK